MRTHRWFVLLCAAAAFAAQTPAPTPASPSPTPAATTAAPSPAEPVLRVETRLVAINVVAKDKKGRPVEDLIKSDFVIRDNNTPRDIAFFSLERMDTPSAAPPLPPGVLSNRIDRQARAATIILFDGLNTALADQSYAHQELLKFLRQMQPDQRVALYALGNTLRILHEFTSDPAELVRASQTSVQNAVHTPGSDTLGGPDLSSGDASVDQSLSDITQRYSEYQNIDRARATIAALNAIAQHVSRLPGRKNLVWISGGFPIFIGQYPNGSSNSVGPSQSFADDVMRLTRTLNDANLAVYPVDARGLVAPTGGPARPHAEAWPQAAPGPSFGSSSLILKAAFSPAPPGRTTSPPPVRSTPPPTANRTSNKSSNANPTPPGITGFDDGYETMALIADKTGGLAFHNRNDLAVAIGSAVDDARLSYAIGFYVPAADLDGKYHELKVSVDRADVKLRHRLGYEATPPAAAAPPVPLTELIHRPLASTDVGLSVSLVKTPSGGQAARINIDTHNLTLVEKDGKWTGQAEMLVMTQQGDISNDQGGTTTVNFNLPPAQYEKVMTDGLTLVKHIALRPGKNDVRIALCDKPSGRAGSIYLSVTMGPPPAGTTPGEAGPAASTPVPPSPHP